MAKFCTDCGNPIIEPSKFCEKCGAKIGETNTGTQPQGIATSQKNNSSKKWFLLLGLFIISIFLLYSGNTGLGVLGVFALIASMGLFIIFIVKEIVFPSKKLPTNQSDQLSTSQSISKPSLNFNTMWEKWSTKQRILYIILAIIIVLLLFFVRRI